MQQSKEHLRSLDQIRGVAILAVFFFHCLYATFGHDNLAWHGWWRDFNVSKSFLLLLPATFGGAGVAIFFVVSGFCIHLSFQRGNPNAWRAFFIRRFFRIYPPYLLALLVFAFIFPTTRLTEPSRLNAAQLGTHLLLVYNFDPRFFFGINSSFWTIAVEAQLYLIYPLLLILAGKLGWRGALIFTGILEVLMRSFAGVYSVLTARDVSVLIWGSPFYYWFSWAIGAALADAYIRGRPLPFRTASWPMWLLAAVCVSFVRPLAPFGFLCFAMATVVIIANLLRRQRPTNVGTSLGTHLRILGVWSYSFYLLHQPIVAAVPTILQKLRISPSHPLELYALCVCTYPFILCLSWFFHRQCELPSIAFGKLLLRRESDPANRELTAAVSTQLPA